MFRSGLQLGVTCKAGQPSAAGLAAAAGGACGRTGGVRRDRCVAAAAMPLNCRARLHAPGQPVACQPLQAVEACIVKGALRSYPLILHRRVTDFRCTAYCYIVPQDLDSLHTAYGSEADLRACLAALHDHNILAIADVVINHRCAQQKARLTWMCDSPVPEVTRSLSAWFDC